MSCANGERRREMYRIGRLQSVIGPPAGGSHGDVKIEGHDMAVTRRKERAELISKR